MSKDYRQTWVRACALCIDAIGSVLFAFQKKPRIDRESILFLTLIKLDRIGDTFLAEPTIAAIRTLFPRARVRMIVAPWNRSVVENNPAIDELVTLSSALDVQKESFGSFLKSKNVAPLVALLRSQACDMAVDLQGNPLNVMAMWRAGIPIRVGLKGKLLSFLLTHAAPVVGDAHQAEIYFSLARLLGWVGQMPLPKIYPSGSDASIVSRFIVEHRLKSFAVFHLGAGRSYRQWPLTFFIALGKKMHERYTDIIPVIVGGADDAAMALQFSAAVPGAINAAGKLSIPQTYELLKTAVLFVGSESGPAHLAGALGVPTLVFMSRWSGISRWKPLGSRVTVLASKNIHSCPGILCTQNPCPNMAAITVDEALSAVAKFFS
jgi:ADP-heptose:LPS heptosyltransferase